MAEFHISPEELEQVRELAESHREMENQTIKPPAMPADPPVVTVAPPSAPPPAATKSTVPNRPRSTLLWGTLWFLGGILVFALASAGSFHLTSGVIYSKVNPGPLLRNMGHDEVFDRIGTDRMDDLPDGRSEEWQDWVGLDRVWNRERRMVCSAVAIFVGVLMVKLYYFFYRMFMYGD